MSAGVLSIYFSPKTASCFLVTSLYITLTERANQSSYVFADLRPVVCCPVVICVTIPLSVLCLVVAGSDGFVIWSVASVAMVASGLRLALSAA
jgi:hypothetical protein